MIAETYMTQTVFDWIDSRVSYSYIKKMDALGELEATKPNTQEYINILAELVGILQNDLNGETQ